MAVLDPSLDRHQIKQMWAVCDPNNAGAVEVNSIHDLLSNRFGKDKVTQRSAGVIERVIKKIIERCGQNAGIKGLQRTLSIMDDNGDKRLTRDELRYVLLNW
jgi:Ca2+-binding EF-hand superfamily protein